MTPILIHGRLNPLWLQKQAERRRLAHVGQVNMARAGAPLRASAQAKASRAEYWRWKKAERKRKRDEARAAQEAARKAAQGPDLFDLDGEQQTPGLDDEPLRETAKSAPEETRAAPRNMRRRRPGHYDALK
jgi:hypothetical protein